MGNLDNVNKVPLVAQIEIDSNLITDNVTNFFNECCNMTNLYAKKNHDYGNSFNKGMDDIGVAYGVGRLYDKMNRIVNLMKIPSAIKEESFEDTVRDLACYAVMLSVWFKQLTSSSTGELK